MTLNSLLEPLIYSSALRMLSSISQNKEVVLRVIVKRKLKLYCLSPRANYTDRATAACRRSDCQLLRIEGATWSA
jgi:hypothetical protein